MRNTSEQDCPNDPIAAWYGGEEVRESSHLEAIRSEWVRREIAEMPLDPARLVRQREAVMARIERESRRGWMPGWWVTAVAATAALAAGVYLYVPGSGPAERAKVSEVASLEEDAKLFAEVAQLAASAEPQAAAPVSDLLAAGE